MGRVLQRKKNRSSTPKIKIKSKKAKNGKKKINVLGNAIIAKNWDKKLTLTQNYHRLGLATRLNAPAGGVEKDVEPLQPTIDAGESYNPLAIKGKRDVQVQPGEARVERDPKTGKILRIIRIEEEGEHEETVEIAGRKRRKMNPLEDPLNELSDAEDYSPRHTDAPTEVVSALEKQAAIEEEKVKKRKPRHQSKREEEWLERLVEKYGDNIPAMVRDRKLNPMQQTEGDIKRRLIKWKGNKK
ncbi:conserved hypothetical protein [Uncinocarpus reesii 1704]|uniref:Nucleolar protein 16 n=1 Tax=Uncinocarpus reesii (strain UAMH 1704) TaxID=336963 RepID=C4JL30_UNCRE|nr:uncharacterized protein UREG_00245 [Uncinocarpus reesii 1704]EEP75399.1 conserved hypothetical protein [Uncinocarpus reesii 1704]